MYQLKQFNSLNCLDFLIRVNKTITIYLNADGNSCTDPEGGGGGGGGGGTGGLGPP